MYAYRQIYNDIQATIPVPPELQHRKTEVIFMVLDEEPIEAENEGLGTLALRIFASVEHQDDVEFQLPEREHGQAVTFE